MKITNRKFWLFLVSLVAVIVLSILSKDATAVIGLFGVYCTGNVASKLSVTTTRKEEENTNITKKEQV